MSTSFKIAITALTSFAGGLVVGMLLTPQSGKENRQWISDSADDAKNWITEKGQTLKSEGQQKISNVKESVKKGVKTNMPNLYEATEDLKLSDEDLANG